MIILPLIYNKLKYLYLNDFKKKKKKDMGKILIL